jgi:hypothetical protein
LYDIDIEFRLVLDIKESFIPELDKELTRLMFDETNERLIILPFLKSYPIPKEDP